MAKRSKIVASKIVASKTDEPRPTVALVIAGYDVGLTDVITDRKWTWVIDYRGVEHQGEGAFGRPEDAVAQAVAKFHELQGAQRTKRAA